MKASRFAPQCSAAVQKSFVGAFVVVSLLSAIQPVQAHGDVKGNAAMPDTSRATGPYGDRAEELLAMVERSVRHHMESCTFLHGRELPSVMAAACKALEGAMNIEATALGVAGLLEGLSV